MKKTVFILAAMAAVLVSCEKEETDNIKQEEVIETVSNDTVF